MIKQKRAWIRIVEASVAILFLAGVTLLILQQGNLEIGENRFSQEIYDSQIETLREIQTNESLRSDIIDINSTNLPSNWNDLTFPASVKNHIEESAPSAITCEAKICSVGDSCVLDDAGERNIYSEFVIISVTTTQPETEGYNPRKLKLFCWE